MSSEPPPESTILQTATPESVREVNRSILLGLTRRLEPVSRADLARRSGIFPSNVSRIVEGLLSEGLLTEERAVPNGRGKVPMLLRLRDDYFPVLGVCVQTRITTVAFAGFSGHIHRTWTLPTPPDPKGFLREVGRLITAIRSEVEPVSGPIRHIGVGAPGFVDAKAGAITCVTSLLPYSGFPLGPELERHTGIPVSVDNDCNLGALSELRRVEASNGPRDFLFLSVGDSGVGAGLILDGKLYRGHDSRFAAEVGHMIVETEGPPCHCGRHGCLEGYVSNIATFRRYKPRAVYTRAAFHRMLAAAAAGDPAAAGAIAVTARYIALAASNIASILNPAEIVLAGEITEAFPVVCEALDTLFNSPHANVTLRRSWSSREAPLVHGTVCLALSAAVPTPAFGLPVTPST